MLLSKNYFKKQTIFIVLSVNYYGVITHYQLLPAEGSVRTPKHKLYIKDYQMIQKEFICKFSTQLEDSNKKLEIFVRPEYTEGRFKIENCDRPFDSVNIFKLVSPYNNEIFYLGWLISLINDNTETTRCFIRHCRLLKSFDYLNSETYKNIIAFFKYIHKELDEDGKLLKDFMDNEKIRTPENKLYLLLNLPECEELLEKL